MTCLLAIRDRVVGGMLVLLLVQVMSGCAGVGGVQSSPTGDDLMKEAQQAVESGAQQRAQTLLEEAARSNPADKQPWIKLAQLHFEQARYAQAITAGQEVLARDNANLDARSIVLVSSLRIAAKSLEELSAPNQLAGDTRAEARKVTLLLRETLGETVLVPAEKPAASTNRKGGDSAKTVGKPPVKRTVRSKPVAPKPATAKSSTGDSDPFRSLR